MKKNKDMLMLAGINEDSGMGVPTNYPARCGKLEAVLWQIRSSLNIALGTVEGGHGSGSEHFMDDPQAALEYLKKSVREALERAEKMEKNPA